MERDPQGFLDRVCRCSIVVSILACHAGDPGSIPSNDDALLSATVGCRHPRAMVLRMPRLDIRLSSLGSTLRIRVPMGLGFPCATHGVLGELSVKQGQTWIDGIEQLPPWATFRTCGGTPRDREGALNVLADTVPQLETTLAPGRF